MRMPRLSLVGAGKARDRHQDKLLQRTKKCLTVAAVAAALAIFVAPVASHAVCEECNDNALCVSSQWYQDCSVAGGNPRVCTESGTCGAGGGCSARVFCQLSLHPQVAVPAAFPLSGNGVEMSPLSDSMTWSMECSSLPARIAVTALKPCWIANGESGKTCVEQSMRQPPRVNPQAVL